jgi:hypothetical protein
MSRDGLTIESIIFHVPVTGIQEDIEGDWWNTIRVDVPAQKNQYLLRPRPKWRNGRRAGLKHQYTRVCVGSSPTFGTYNKTRGYDKSRVLFFTSNSLLLPQITQKYTKN